MKYLLDTNICIHFFRGEYHIDKKIEEVSLQNCFLSEITLAELMYGAENSKNAPKNLKLIDLLISQITILPIFDSLPIYAKKKPD